MTALPSAGGSRLTSIRESLMNRISTSLLLLASSLPLCAAEMMVSDLRFAAGILSNSFDGASSTTVTNTSSNTATTTSSEDDGRNADSHYRAQIQYMRGHLGNGGGFIYGLGVAVNNANFENDSGDANVTTPVVDLLLGYGYAFTPGWHLEITPFAGIGRAYYSVDVDGATSISDETTSYVEYGIKAGTYFMLGDSFQVGLEVPYLASSFEPEYNYTDEGDDQVTVSDERNNQGFGVLLSIGGRF